ncbi:MAG: septum formation protein Maf [Anaerolineales bacterium]|nr:septum formation protein Maf [Anaerolineales bacterium]
MSLVLASSSPRRKQLFGLGNWNFEVIVADLDESVLPGETPRAYVLRLAQAKALAVAPKVSGDSIIVGSDTSVIDGAEILGKPTDAEDAAQMLRQLRGRTHQVFTAIAIYRASDQKLATDLCVTDVPMRDYTEAELQAYIGTGDPLDKAGAYAIQHAEFNPVVEMQGCFAGVMGLPMCHVTRALKAFGVQPNADVPLGCQKLLKYECLVSGAILRGEMV